MTKYQYRIRWSRRRRGGELHTETKYTRIFYTMSKAQLHFDTMGRERVDDFYPIVPGSLTFEVRAVNYGEWGYIAGTDPAT